MRPLFCKHVILAVFLFWLAPFIVSAQTVLPLEVQQAVVYVVCENRQGSGTVINGQDGYVVTNAHVAIDLKTKLPAASCQIGFVESSGGQATIFYEAAVVRFTFDEQRNQDFAILQIGRQLSRRGMAKPFPFLKTNEFSIVGENVFVLGYSKTDRSLAVRTGTITGFESGFINVTAMIVPGDSGGAGLDPNYRLIGMPTRIVYTQSSTGSQIETYELVDIRAVMNWLDTFGVNEHDKFFTHEDFARYHQNVVFISEANLGCEFVARTSLSSTVYCAKTDGTRQVFPNNATFFSWFPDFKNVITSSLNSIVQYDLTKNVTYKPGTLIKSATSPQVYVVIDGFGNIRLIPSEARATQLWGPNWAALVHDIPDEFWINYTVGQPID